MYFIAISELNESKNHSIDGLCELAGVSRSVYYKWKSRNKSNYEIEMEELAQQIRRIFDESDKTFGVIRIQYALK